MEVDTLFAHDFTLENTKSITLNSLGEVATQISKKMLKSIFKKLSITEVCFEAIVSAGWWNQLWVLVRKSFGVHSTESGNQVVLYIIYNSGNNPLRTVTISKLLEMIRVFAYLPRLLDHDRSPLGHKPDYRNGWLSEHVRQSIHACQCVDCVQASADS